MLRQLSKSDLLDNRAYLFSEAIASIESAFGMEDGTIPNAQITGSSFYSADSLYAYEGRLKHTKYWATSIQNPSNPWIQVVLSLVEPVTITAIQVQGSAFSAYSEWVKTLQIQTGDSEASLAYIMDGNMAAVS